MRPHDVRTALGQGTKIDLAYAIIILVHLD